VVAALALIAGLAALGGSPSTLAAPRAQTADTPDHVTIRLRETGDTGISGKATLRTGDGVTRIGIRLTGTDDAYPAHLHQGTCKEFEAMPKFPLADAEPGKTTRTVLDVPLEELLAGGYVINIHQPAMDLDSLLDPASVVACGEVAVTTASMTGTGGTDAGESIQPPVTGVGPAIPASPFGVLSIGLTALAFVLAGAGVALRRSERRPSSPYAT
jgi:hypothetical protein